MEDRKPYTVQELAGGMKRLLHWLFGWHDWEWPRRITPTTHAGYAAPKTGVRRTTTSEGLRSVPSGGELPRQLPDTGHRVTWTLTPQAQRKARSMPIREWIATSDPGALGFLVGALWACLMIGLIEQFWKK